MSRTFTAIVGLLLCCPAGHAQQDEVAGKKKGEWIKMLAEEKAPRKRQAAVLALGLIGPTQRDVAQALTAALKEDPSELVRQEVVGVVSGLKKEELRDWVPRLADALKYDKNAAVRARAAGVLGKLGDLAKPVLSNLIASLKDEDATTRAAVVEAIARMGAEAKIAIPDMLPLLNDKQLTVRAATVFAIGRMGPEATAAVHDLSAILANDTAPDVRRETARSLGQIGAAEGVPALVKAIQNDSAPDVRQQAVLALGKIGPEVKPVLGTLRDLLKNDKDKTVRLFLVRMLPSSLGADAKEIVNDLATRLSAEPEGEVRLAIIEELGALGPDARPALPALRNAQRDIQVPVREAANAAIRKIQAKKE